jgi:ligand-binding sensor domain-containing protein
MPNRVSKTLIIIFVLSWNIHTSANVFFYHYGIEKGLPEVKIISIDQDSTGYIWMAGENSIYRFDGTHFKSYRNSHTRLTVQPFRNITKLFTDCKGIIWAGSSQGFAYYDSHRDGFVALAEGWNRENVNDFTHDKFGFLWMATDGGLAQFDPVTKTTIWFTDSANVKTQGNNILPAVNITYVASQDDGKIWFATSQNGLYRFDPQNRSLENFSLVEETDFGLAQISNLEFANNLLFVSTKIFIHTAIPFTISGLLVILPCGLPEITG